MEESKYKGSYQADSWKSSESDNQMENNDDKIEELEKEFGKAGLEEDVKLKN